MELPVFQGFGPEVFEWFAGLERDNTKAYFTATRDLYEHAVRGGLEAMLDELAMEFGGEARVFRQQRDLRFTPDKTPYKTRTYGVIHGTSVPGAGLYAQLSVNGLYAGTGYWRLARDQLERYRAAVATTTPGRELEAVTAAAQDAGLELSGESLRTAPRGYPRDHPRIELLRRKSLIAGRALTGEGGIDRARRARPRRRRVAGRGAAERLARRARRAEHPAARAARRTPLSSTDNRTPVREMPRSRAPQPAAILPVPPLSLSTSEVPHAALEPALLAAAVAMLAVALPSTALAHPHAKEYTLAEFAGPNHITTGPDGALWASDGSLNRLWRVTTKGKVSSIELEGGATGVATGRDGALWVTDRDVNASSASRPAADHVLPAAHRGRLPDRHRLRPRRGALVHRDARQQDRPHHDQGSDHRVPDPDPRRVRRRHRRRPGRRDLVHRVQRQQGRPHHHLGTADRVPARDARQPPRPDRRRARRRDLLRRDQHERHHAHDDRRQGHAPVPAPDRERHPARARWRRPTAS